MWFWISLCFFSPILFAAVCSAQDAPFSTCPLLGPRFPIPLSISGSPIIKQGFQNLTAAIDAYMATGTGDFGQVTPNTTSFSIALFSVEDSNSTESFIYEYHHTASSMTNSTTGVKDVNKDSVYRVGDLTTLFTTWLFLVEAGEQHWSEPVSKWVPELASYASSADLIGRVQWDKVTLGDIAAHLGGIGRYLPSTSPMDFDLGMLLSHLGAANTSSPCATTSSSCDRVEFLKYFGTQAPAFEPGSTPIFSNTGFIILAYALESITGHPYADLLNNTVLSPLSMSSTSLLRPAFHEKGVIPSNPLVAEWDSPVAIEAAFNGVYSSLSDISAALRSIMRSDLLDPSVTNRWLKPVSLTSNSVNSVGRPWEIYSLVPSGATPVIPVFQVRGNVGLYSSHIGLVPDYGVGFAILAADSDVNPDLNAYADLISIAMVPALEENAITQASAAFAGTYNSSSTSANGTSTSLTITQAMDSTPGLALTKFAAGGTDVLALYAKLLTMAPEDLSFRLYPTDLMETTGDSTRMAFRAIFQDLTEVGDAGTPTCDSWRSVDKLQMNGVGMDEFIFEIRNKKVVGVEVLWMGVKLAKGS